MCLTTEKLQYILNPVDKTKLFFTHCFAPENGVHIPLMDDLSI